MTGKEKYEELKLLVLTKIKNVNANTPITGKKLKEELNIPSRTVKSIITELREEYPIVSKETNGGGYWIATTDLEILEFIRMMEHRKQGYEKTIKKMIKFLN